MRSLASRLSRMEKRSEREDAASRGQDRKLSHRICALLVLHEPGMARVRREHTDPETFRHIQETLAWARGDFLEAERLADLAANKHVPAPPGTPWEEQLRLAREALDATADEAEDRTKRVRAAVRVATGANG